MYEEPFLDTFILKTRDIAHLSSTKDFSQPNTWRHACAICVLHVKHHTSPVPPFLIMQNISTKDMAESDIVKLEV